MKTKHLIAAVLSVSGAILMSQSTFAQTTTFVMNDLYLGFQNSGGGGTADYIINLGPATNILGKAAVVDLSSDFSSGLFNNASLQGTASQVYGGVVGAITSAGNGGTAIVYGTTLRTSNFGTPSVAGSSAPAGDTLRSTDNSIESALSTVAGPSAGTGVLDTTKSWEVCVEPAITANSYYGSAGFNPDSQVSPSTVLYEDLYETADAGDPRGGSGQPWNYVGYFKLDLTGASPKLTFSSTNAPGTLTGPVIASIMKTGGTVTIISSNAVPTHSYQLRYTTSLSPTNWISVGSSVVATGTTVTNTDSTATDAKRFYQIQAQ